ncbi:hypothetical protein BDV29DRAFT_118966 [Aspergillus leporis]|uniref:Uncharacterized protein n=1 Tax=Aspergillus leporis TaxID=41062 RepID=A0A5N5X1N1_9EURO|nr:hypothetical protein BDV29DRAFT_118966 [Aspergillus leporis]
MTSTHFDMRLLCFFSFSLFFSYYFVLMCLKFPFWPRQLCQLFPPVILIPLFPLLSRYGWYGIFYFL